jgi:hypothetical protein
MRPLSSFFLTRDAGFFWPGSSPQVELCDAIHVISRGTKDVDARNKSEQARA